MLKVKGEPVNLTRINSVDSLNLNPTVAFELQKLVYENRLMWEPFMVSFDTFDEFVTFLKKSSYKILPLSESAEITNKENTPLVISNTLKKKTMVQKG
jgi:hypothetical protein